jgi:ABC-type dipeptide/oligopeptide/nickel transport system permease subunit
LVIVGWSALLLVTSVAARVCSYISFLLLPLIVVALGSMIASVVAAIKHGWWWLIVTLAAILLLFSVLGTFEGC